MKDEEKEPQKRIAVASRRSGTASRLDFVLEVGVSLDQNEIGSIVEAELRHNYPGWELAYWADMGIPL